jgi:hypothetical protein
MTIRHLRVSITRLVLVVAMVAAVAAVAVAGGVALGPTHEAAAMTNDEFCGQLVNNWWYRFNLGQYAEAIAISDAYADLC